MEVPIPKLAFSKFVVKKEMLAVVKLWLCKWLCNSSEKITWEDCFLSSYCTDYVYMYSYYWTSGTFSTILQLWQGLGFGRAELQEFRGLRNAGLSYRTRWQPPPNAHHRILLSGQLGNRPKGSNTYGLTLLFGFTLPTQKGSGQVGTSALFQTTVWLTTTSCHKIDYCQLSKSYSKRTNLSPTSYSCRLGLTCW